MTMFFEQFDRFEQQCVECPCYIENADEGDAVDPDCDCTLGHSISGENECEDFGGE
ncbi:MAG: hypothetical protein GY797_38730 [Deltaproteobacteria bacterium]|nr:hypothetical protein [Deltaproteobacteria bacterium]